MESFWDNVLVTIGLRWKISRKFCYFLAHNFAALLSGWVRLRDRAMAWVFFVPELGKGVSSWEGRKSAGKVKQIKLSE